MIFFSIFENSAPEEILAIEDSRDPENQKKAGTGNWKYTVKNSMFYGGDKEAEKVYTFKKPFKPREICHENTRFKKDPFLKPIGMCCGKISDFMSVFSAR